MKVIITDYSAAWPQKFEAEKLLLEPYLPDSSAVEHIGSTAVRGLAAKPVIDIMIGITDFSLADSLVLKIETLGYEYVSEFESVMPYRRYFRKENEGIRTHQIHLVEIGSEFWNRHLLFRDYLRKHPQVAAEYSSLKRRLAQREWDDVNDYAAAKTPFIQSIEAKALQESTQFQ